MARPRLIVVQTPVFIDWMEALGDRVAKARILARIDAAKMGHFGDCKPIGHGVSEMRVHYGPGYRIYYKRTGNVVYVLLCGGTKSDQASDIRRAQVLADGWKDLR